MKETSNGKEIHVSKSSNDRLKFGKFIFQIMRSYFTEEIPQASVVDELKTKAEEEFREYYGTYPTCAVYAPGSLTIGGKNKNLAQSKSLSMAVQLVTVVVGKRNHGSKWCYVRTMAEDVIGGKVFDVYLNKESLEISMEENSWVRYVKGTIRCFKARRAHVPGFKIVIASNVPMKRGLGSSSALVVALYTFLESITSLCTFNVLEKTLACYWAEKLAVNPCGVHLGDVLTSVVGIQDKIFSFDSRSLQIQAYNWNSKDVTFILIEHDAEESPLICRNDENKEVLILRNTVSKWRTHPLPDSMIQLLVSPVTIKMSDNINDEDDRIERMAKKIESEEWEDLGKLMGENHRSMDELKNVEGFLGISVNGASVVTLVRGSKLKGFVSFWKRNKITEKCYVMKSCGGASVIYSYERRFLPSGARKHRPKFINKYHLKGEDTAKGYYCRFESGKSVPFFVPYASYFD